MIKNNGYYFILFISCKIQGNIEVNVRNIKRMAEVLMEVIMTSNAVNVIGAGLAGSEAAWQLAKRGYRFVYMK